MPTAVDLATAYIALKPSMQGFRNDVTTQIAPHLSSAGTEGGASLGTALLGGLKKFAAPVAGLLAGFQVKRFVSDSVASFEDYTLAVRQFGRVSGGSVEQFSGLRAAMQLSGVDVDSANTAVTFFSKTLGNNATDSAKAAALTAKLGTSFLDAAGNVKPMSDILPGLADKFAAMPDGAQKTALAVSLFGRSGATLLPFLNQGSAGIAQFTDQAKKMGLVLDDTSVNIFGRAKASQREVAGSIQGLKVAFGQTLSPAIEGAGNLFEAILIPSLQAVTRFLQAARGPVLEFGLRLTAMADTVQAKLSGFLQGINLSSLSAVFAPVLNAIAQLGPVIGPLIPQILSLGSAFSPLHLAISALAPLLPSIIGTLTQLAGTLAGALAQALVTVLPNILQLASALTVSLGTALVAIMPAVLAVINQLVGLFVQLAPIVAQLVAALLPLATTIITALVQGFLLLVPPITQLVTTVLPPLVQIFAAVVAAIAPLIVQLVNALTPAIQALLPVVTTVFGAIVNIISAAMPVVAAVIRTVLALIQGNWTGVWQGLQAIVAGIWNLIVAVVTNGLNAVNAVITGVLGTIRALWTGAWNALVAFLSGVWAQMTASVQNGFVNVLAWFAGLGARILGAIGNIGGILVGIGASIMGGFFEGLVSGWSQVANWVSGIGQWIRDNKGPEAKDRALLVPAGKWIMEGLRDSMEEEIPAMEAMLGRMSATFRANAFVAPFAAAGENAGRPEPANVAVYLGNELLDAHTTRIVQAQQGVWSSDQSRRRNGI